MENITFKQALKYPFNRPKALLNGLWILVPIFGWLAILSYSVRIINELIEGKIKQMPKISPVQDFKDGFFLLLKSLPFLLLYTIIFEGLIYLHQGFEFLRLISDLLIVPILAMNFCQKQTIESYFEFDILNKVFDNFKEYFVITLKSIGLMLTFLVLCIVIVGIPALMFGTYFFYANFYSKYLLKKSNKKKKEIKEK